MVVVASTYQVLPAGVVTYNRVKTSTALQYDKPTYDLLKTGQRQAVELLYNRYGKKLYSYAISHWKLDEDASWELVYQTLYKVTETYQRYSFANEDKFGAFIFKMFINYLRNNYRDNKRMDEKASFVNFNESELENYDEQTSVGREVKQRITEQDARNKEEEKESIPISLLKAELEQLEDWQRMLLLMRCQDIPYQTISEMVGKPETQLKVYYQRLKARIMKKLSPKLQTITKS